MAQPDFAARNQLTELVRERKDALTIRWLWAMGATGATAIGLALVGETHAREVPTILGVLCWLAALVLAVLSVALPLGRLGDKPITQHLRSPLQPERWAASMRLSSEQTRTYLALPKSEQRMLSLTLLFERPYTLGLGLASGIVLVALIYGLLTKTMVDSVPFLLAAFAAQAWHYPRLTRLVERGRAIEAKADDTDALDMLEALQAGRDGSAPARRSSRPPPSRPSSSRPPPRKR